MFENRIHLSILNAWNKYLHIHQLIQLSSSSELSRSELAFSEQGAPVSRKASRRFLCEFSFAGRPLFFGCAPFFTAFWLSPRLLFWMVSRIRSLMFWTHCADWYLEYAGCIYILVNQCNGLNLMNHIRDNCQVLVFKWFVVIDSFPNHGRSDVSLESTHQIMRRVLWSPAIVDD